MATPDSIQLGTGYIALFPSRMSIATLLTSASSRTQSTLISPPCDPTKQRILKFSQASLTARGYDQKKELEPFSMTSCLRPTILQKLCNSVSRFNLMFVALR